MDCYPGAIQFLVRITRLLTGLNSRFVDISVNANAENLRSQFVAHKGKKKLVVRAIGNRYSVDFGDLANQMTELIDQNVWH